MCCPSVISSQDQCKEGPFSKRLVNATFVKEVNPNERFIKVFRQLYQQKHCQFKLKDRQYKMKRALEAPNSTGRKQTEKTTQLKKYATFLKKGRIMIKTGPRTQRLSQKA